MIVILRLLFLLLLNAFFDLISFNTYEEGSCAFGRVVQNFLLLSDSAGKFNWWSTGVALHDSIAGFHCHAIRNRSK